MDSPESVVEFPTRAASDEASGDASGEEIAHLEALLREQAGRVRDLEAELTRQTGLFRELTARVEAPLVAGQASSVEASSAVAAFAEHRAASSQADALQTEASSPGAGPARSSAGTAAAATVEASALSELPPATASAAIPKHFVQRALEAEAARIDAEMRLGMALAQLQALQSAAATPLAQAQAGQAAQLEPPAADTAQEASAPAAAQSMESAAEQSTSTTPAAPEDLPGAASTTAAVVVPTPIKPAMPLGDAAAEQIAAAEAARDSARLRVGVLEQELIAARAEVQGAAGRVEQVHQSLSQSQGQVQALEQQLRQFRQKLFAMETAVGESDRARAAAQEQSTLAVQERGQLQDRLQALATELEEARRSQQVGAEALASLTETRSTLEATVAEQDEALAKALQEAEAVHGRLEVESTRAHEALRALQALETERAQDAVRMEDLERAVTALRTQSSGQQEVQLTQAQEELQVLQAQLAQAEEARRLAVQSREMELLEQHRSEVATEVATALQRAAAQQAEAATQAQQALDEASAAEDESDVPARLRTLEAELTASAQRLREVESALEQAEARERSLQAELDTRVSTSVAPTVPVGYWAPDEVREGEATQGGTEAPQSAVEASQGTAQGNADESASQETQVEAEPADVANDSEDLRRELEDRDARLLGLRSELERARQTVAGYELALETMRADLQTAKGQAQEAHPMEAIAERHSDQERLAHFEEDAEALRRVKEATQLERERVSAQLTRVQDLLRRLRAGLLELMNAAEQGGEPPLAGTTQATLAGEASVPPSKQAADAGPQWVVLERALESERTARADDKQRSQREIHALSSECEVLRARLEELEARLKVSMGVAQSLLGEIRSGDPVAAQMTELMQALKGDIL